MVPNPSLKRVAAELIARTTERQSPSSSRRTASRPRCSRTSPPTSADAPALHLLKLAAERDRDYDQGKVHDAAAVDAAVRQRLDLRDREG